MTSKGRHTRPRARISDYTLNDCNRIVKAHWYRVEFDMWRGDQSPAWSCRGDLETCVRHAFRGREYGFDRFWFFIKSAKGPIGECDGFMFELLSAVGIRNEAELDEHVRRCRRFIPDYSLMGELVCIFDYAYVFDDGSWEFRGCPPSRSVIWKTDAR